MLRNAVVRCLKTYEEISMFFRLLSPCIVCSSFTIDSNVSYF